MCLGISATGCTASSPTENTTRILGPRTTVIVTTDGGRHLVTRRSIRLHRGDSALDVLREVADVRMTLTGGVAQVNGLGGGALRTFGPEDAAWFYRVDGIETLATEPDRFRVRSGQSIWWDLRRRDIYARLPVSVGVFPEPLISGWRGKPERIRISYGSAFKDDAKYLNSSVFEDLDPEVVSIYGGGGIAGLGGESSNESQASTRLPVAVRTRRANLVIGRWEEIQIDPNIADIGLDPNGYGLTIWIEGTQIRRQDPDMEFSQVLRDAEGIVWASTIDGEPDSTLVFVVTGLTDRGVKAASRALRSGACQFYIACAVDRSGAVIS